MQTSFSPNQRQDVLRWLRHGAELAKDAKGERASHRDVIWALLIEAVTTTDRLPDQEKRWLTSGTRSGGWNMVGMTPTESNDIERLRMLSAMKPFDGQTKVSPPSIDIDRAIGVLDWLRWCNSTRMSDRLKKAAIALARGGETDAVHRIYCPTRKPHRQNIHEIKIRTAGLILSGLKNDMGIVASGDLSFTEIQ